MNKQKHIQAQSFLPPDSGSHISFDCLRCPMGRKCLLSLQSGHCDVSHCRSRKVSPAKTQLYTDYPACIIPNGLKCITMLLHACHQAMAKTTTTTTTLTKDNDSFIRSILEVLQMLPQKKSYPVNYSKVAWNISTMDSQCNNADRQMPFNKSCSIALSTVGVFPIN